MLPRFHRIMLFNYILTFHSHTGLSRGGKGGVFFRAHWASATWRISLEICLPLVPRPFYLFFFSLLWFFLLPYTRIFYAWRCSCIQLHRGWADCMRKLLHFYLLFIYKKKKIRWKKIKIWASFLSVFLHLWREK